MIINWLAFKECRVNADGFDRKNFSWVVIFFSVVLIRAGVKPGTPWAWAWQMGANTTLPSVFSEEVSDRASGSSKRHQWWWSMSRTSLRRSLSWSGCISDCRRKDAKWRMTNATVTTIFFSYKRKVEGGKKDAGWRKMTGGSTGGKTSEPIPKNSNAKPGDGPEGQIQ